MKKDDTGEKASSSAFPGDCNSISGKHSIPSKIKIGNILSGRAIEG